MKVDKNETTGLIEGQRGSAELATAFDIVELLELVLDLNMFAGVVVAYRWPYEQSNGRTDNMATTTIERTYAVRSVHSRRACS